MARVDPRILVTACLYVAIADRDVDRDEMAALVERLERSRPGLSRGDASRLVGQAVADLGSDGSDGLLRALGKRRHRRQAAAVLRAALATAAADGALGEAEAERLREVAEALSVGPEELERVRRDYAAEAGLDPATLRPRSHRD